MDDNKGDDRKAPEAENLEIEAEAANEAEPEGAAPEGAPKKGWWGRLKRKLSGQGSEKESEEAGVLSDASQEAFDAAQEPSGEESEPQAEYSAPEGEKGPEEPSKSIDGPIPQSAQAGALIESQESLLENAETSPKTSEEPQEETLKEEKLKEDKLAKEPPKEEKPQSDDSLEEELKAEDSQEEPAQAREPQEHDWQEHDWQEENPQERDPQQQEPRDKKAPEQKLGFLGRLKRKLSGQSARQEIEAQETEAQETEAQEAESQELDEQESGLQEAESQEAENLEAGQIFETQEASPASEPSPEPLGQAPEGLGASPAEAQEALEAEAALALQKAAEAPPAEEKQTRAEKSQAEEPQKEEHLEEEHLEEEPKEEKLGFLARLKRKLSSTREMLAGRLERALSAVRRIDEDVLEELEEIMITSDLGVKTTNDILQKIRGQVASKELKDADALKKAIKARMTEMINLPLPAEPKVNPLVILMVGVNGVGKTTTIAKLARRYQSEGRKVLIAAADTFRAAAVEQLTIWAQRVGADIVSQPTGSDPSAVVFDSLTAAKARSADVVLIDTAGRLHTKSNLMDELKKIKRVAGKAMEGAPHETILVLDANTGQNAVSQAALFDEAIGVDRLVITKLDGTSKGGVIVSIIHERRLPVAFIGLGETYEDLRPFDPEAFVEAILGAD